MSELFRNHHEHTVPSREIDVGAEVEKHLKKLETEEQRAEQSYGDTSIEEIRTSIEDASHKTETLTDSIDSQVEQQDSPFLPSLHGNLKRETYRKTLDEIQQELSPRQKIASKMFHHPTVEAISDTLSKTAARPMSSTIASIIISIGVAISLYLSYRYGFEFNYLLFFFLFVGGYAIGLIVELTILVPLQNKRTKLHN